MAARKRGLQGVDEMKKRLDIILRNVNEAVIQTIDDSADDLLERSQDLSPQLTGAHIHSGKVVEISQFARAVAYDEAYSLWLHEGDYELGPVSRLKPPTQDGAVGKEFLLRPFENNKQRYIADAGKAVAEAVRRSVR